MIEFNGIQYQLKYNMKRIELIESMTEKSFMSEVTANNGMFSIRTLKTYIAYALKEIDGNFVAYQKGIEIAESLIENEGYVKMNKMVVVAVQNDCPFFFQGA